MSKEFELVYSTQRTGFEEGRNYSNPRFFTTPRAGVTKVIVVGNWPQVVAAYQKAGVPVEVVKGPRMAGEDPKPAPKMTDPGKPLASDAAIPEGWADLPWDEKRALAQNFAAAPIINSEQADAAIMAEIERRGMVVFPPAGDTGNDLAHMSDDELREKIKAVTGRLPHPATGRKKLETQLREAREAAAKPEPRIAAGGGSSAGGVQ